MSTFSDSWLKLREPHDAASRAAVLVDTLAAALQARPIAVTDLAAGTGANLRYLSPRLGGLQQWRLIDHDHALLDALPARLDDWADELGATVTDGGDALTVRGRAFECRIERVCADLAQGIEALSVPPDSLVTASALLDLVSARWLGVLADRCRDAHATALLALSYDGRIRFEPRESADATVNALVNLHQRSDKGFGPALGPTAAERAAEIFTAQGFRVAHARSDWHVDGRNGALQNALVADWAAAAQAVDADAADAIEQWAERRRTLIAQQRSRLTVGHVDLLAQPPSR